MHVMLFAGWRVRAFRALLTLLFFIFVILALKKQTESTEKQTEPFKCNKSIKLTQTQLISKNLKYSMVMSQRWLESSQKYYSYVNKVQMKCNATTQVGHHETGVWYLCDDDKYKPKQPCFMYAFSFKKGWSYIRSVAQSYGCHVHVFESSITGGYENQSDVIHYHKLSIAETYTHGINLLERILEKLGHKPDHVQVLNIDSDTTYLSLEEMLKKGTLKNITQFVFQLHFPIAPGQKEPSLALYEWGFQLLQQVYDEGFRIFKTDPSCGFESSHGSFLYGCHTIHTLRLK